MRRIQKRLDSLSIVIDPIYIAVITAAYEELIQEDQHRLLELLPFDQELGQSDCEYHIVDTPITVRGEEIKFLKGVVVKGQFYPPTHVDEYVIQKEQCDVCSTYTHCLKQIDNKTYCNKCMQLSEDPKVSRMSGGLQQCEICSVTRCHNHPLKIY